jgi:cyanophycin synthetase
MKIQKVNVLRGPNFWARFPVLEAWVDLGELKDRSSDEMPGFNERLMGWLPSLVEHRCSVGQRGGFFERLRRGTYLAHILEHVTIELQSLSGSDVGFGRARETNEPGVYKVAIEYQDEAHGQASLDAGHSLCLAAVRGDDFDVVATVQRLRCLFEENRLGPSTSAIVDAARRRGIPARRLNRGSLVQLGWGTKQRRVLAAETDRTSAIAESIAQDKELTRALLSRLGVPVPRGRAVTGAEDAWAAALEVGLPVVVKPQFGNHGRGVATDLSTRERVVAAYDAARAHGSDVIVETFAPGDDYRVLVVGGRVVAAAKREPAQVVGDGASCVRALVDAVNADPRRADGHAASLSRIDLDDETAIAVLAEQGHTTTSIPRAGERVLIRRNGNLSTGGTAKDVTERLHPEVVARSVEAARIVGLDIAGIDIVCRDIGRPLEEQAGAIVEVNAGPGLRMHLDPSVGTPRPVGQAIVDMMFPRGEIGRVPVVGVTGVNGKTTVTRFLGHLARESGHKVGMACTDGIYLGLRRLEAGDCAGPRSAEAVLAHPDVELAVLETARGGILRGGLGFDQCQVAVVTNIGDGDHLGLADVDTLDKLARVKRTLVEAVSAQGFAVLNALDPLVAAMAEHCPGEVIYFARDESSPVLAAHRAEGGRVVFEREGEVFIANGYASEGVLISIEDAPLTAGGRIGFQVENLLATAGAAWALGLDMDTVRAGMQSFASDTHMLPGRFNLMEIEGATVLVDYGHNSSALRALVEALGAFPHERRLAVYTAAGDRRDQDMIDQGRLLGQSFDAVYLFEDLYRRGRANGEIIGLIERGIASAGAERRTRVVERIEGARAATERALRAIQRGDLLVIQADVVDETMSFLRAVLESRLEHREVDLDAAIATAEGSLVKVGVRSDEGED